MKIKRIVFCILIFASVIMLGKMTYEIRNYYRVAKDTEPVILYDYPNHTLILFYLQRDMEPEEIPLNIETEGGVVLNAENREEILTIQYGEGIVKYNYEKDEVEGLLTYEGKNQLTDGGTPEEMHFVPGGNSISFCIENKIYTYDYDNRHCEEVYEDHSGYFYRMGFPYKWKNASEMYLTESDNLILYNVETKQKEIVYEGLGKCYFHMSQGGEYLTYQPQRGRKQKIILLNIETGEKKTIHRAKSDEKVRVTFSPDGRYIFLEDFNKNSLFDPQYWYLYDLKTGRRYSVDVGDRILQSVRLD